MVYVILGVLLLIVVFFIWGAIRSARIGLKLGNKANKWLDEDKK